MSMLIDDLCILCGACEPVCPNEAIFEGPELYEVTSELCTECVGFYDEQQCVEVCPVDAVIFNPDDVETLEELRAKYLAMHPDRAPTGGWDKVKEPVA